LNHDRGRTVVVVLHDLNQAARYADHLIAMKEGQVVASGTPAEVVTAERVLEVFGLECVVVPDPVTGSPLVVPGVPWQGAREEEEAQVEADSAAEVDADVAERSG
jgi:iron complex transport system ATP-binding protein